MLRLLRTARCAQGDSDAGALGDATTRRSTRADNRCTRARTLRAQAHERRVADGVVPSASAARRAEEWHVLHPRPPPRRYISFDALPGEPAAAARVTGARRAAQGGGAAREGRALLQGLIRCGRCGRLMQVGLQRRKTLVRALRVRAAASSSTAAERCQISRRSADRAGRPRRVFEALRPAAHRGDAEGDRARQRRP